VKDLTQGAKIGGKKKEDEDEKFMEKIIKDDKKIDSSVITKDMSSVLANSLQSNDPLDSSDFNPVDYINKLFPNGEKSFFIQFKKNLLKYRILIFLNQQIEQSLVNIDKVLGRLKQRNRKLDNEIREVVRSQTNAGEEGKKELEEAKRSITVKILF